MKFPHRRQFLHLAAGAAALPAASRVARAQSYPTRPVRIVAGFSSGSAIDTLARLLGQWLTEKLGQSFFVEDRGGAGGNLGAEAVVRSAPDGYTLLLCGSPDAINATLYDKLSFNFLRDTTPVAAISRGPQVLVVHPSFPARTIPEFIAYTKVNPGKVDFASAGVGSVSHMAGELFMAMTGVRMVHVPYRGVAPAVTDLLGGQVNKCKISLCCGDQALPISRRANAGAMRSANVRAIRRWTDGRRPQSRNLFYWEAQTAARRGSPGPIEWQFEQAPSFVMMGSGVRIPLAAPHKILQLLPLFSAVSGAASSASLQGTTKEPPRDFSGHSRSHFPLSVFRIRSFGKWNSGDWAHPGSGGADALSTPDIPSAPSRSRFK
jgi:hypothetical protein